MEIVVRDESTDDHLAIRSVTEDAFSNCPLGHHGEADLIERFRTEAKEFISLVACVDECIVGHALFTPANVVFDQQKHFAFVDSAFHPVFVQLVELFSSVTGSPFGSTVLGPFGSFV